MKRLSALVASATVCAAIAAPALAAPKTRTVSVKDDVFSPKSMTVSQRTTVRWVWRGTSPHNVSVVSGAQRFRSGNKVKGSFSRRLTRKGTYRLTCTIHPGMNQTIRVR